jgi:hypothetical protein
MPITAYYDYIFTNNRIDFSAMYRREDMQKGQYPSLYIE